MKASAWIVFSYPLSMAMQIGRSLILTRLLYPEAFGLMALVGVVLNGLKMFSDIGISAAIVQHPDGEKEEFLQTAWTIQVIRGLGLWLAACLLAWPAARFYDEPGLLLLIPASGLNLIVSGFRTTAISTTRRRLQIVRISIYNYATDFVTLVAIVVIAWITRSVWALVWGSLVGAFVYTILSFLVFPGISHRFRWNRDVVRDLLRFGRWLMLSTILTFLAQQGDRLILGKLIPTDVLGVYSIALVVAMAARGVVTSLNSSVLFPVLAEKSRGPVASLQKPVLQARGNLLRLAFMACAGVSWIAPLFFHALYDSRYWAAGWMAQFLAFHAWVYFLQNTSGHVLLALGNSRGLALSNGATVIASFLLAIAGHHLAGVRGFVGGMVIGTALGEVVAVTLLAKENRIRLFGQDARSSLAALAVVVGGILVNSAISSRYEGLAAWGMQGACSILVLAPLGWLNLRSVLPIILKRRRRQGATA